MRWFLFFVTIVVGIAAGVVYGWKVNPVEYTDTSPASFAMAYKADYVLMVAEVYQKENVLRLAEQRLSALGSQPAKDIVQDAIRSAEPHYVQSDLALMRALWLDLRNAQPASETPAP